MLDSRSSRARSLPLLLRSSKISEALQAFTIEEVESIQMVSHSMLQTRESNMTFAISKEKLSNPVPTLIKAEDTEKDFYFLLNNSKPYGVSDYTNLLISKLESISKEAFSTKKMNLQSMILSVIQNRDGSISLQKSFDELPVECFKILISQVN